MISWRKNFYSGISAVEQHHFELIVNILQNGGIYIPSLREIKDYDAVLVLGKDLTQTGVRIALAVRQAQKVKQKQWLQHKK